MGSVNKIIIIGNLGADPELRNTPGGQSVCSLRVATTDAWNDKDGQKQERTEWHSVSVWGNQAAACGQYLAKGRQVYVEGKLESREYQDKEGVQRKVWEIRAFNVVFLADGQGARGGAGAGQGAPAQGGQGGGWGDQGNQGGNAGRPAGGQQGGSQRPQGGGWPTGGQQPNHGNQGNQGGGWNGQGGGGGGQQRGGPPAGPTDPIPF